MYPCTGALLGGSHEAHIALAMEVASCLAGKACSFGGPGHLNGFPKVRMPDQLCAAKKALEHEDAETAAASTEPNTVVHGAGGHRGHGRRQVCWRCRPAEDDRCRCYVVSRTRCAVHSCAKVTLTFTEELQKWRAVAGKDSDMITLQVRHGGLSVGDVCQLRSTAAGIPHSVIRQIKQASGLMGQPDSYGTHVMQECDVHCAFTLRVVHYHADEVRFQMGVYCIDESRLY